MEEMETWIINSKSIDNAVSTAIPVLVVTTGAVLGGTTTGTGPIGVRCTECGVWTGCAVECGLGDIGLISPSSDDEEDDIDPCFRGAFS